MIEVTVSISKFATKQILKAPKDITVAIQKWVFSVEEIGLEETRRIGGKGLHDELLKGELKGLRSIRLNRSWRLYYSEGKGEPKIISIERVDKHNY
jgi:plasmid maintenance system killer protein